MVRIPLIAALLFMLSVAWAVDAEACGPRVEVRFVDDAGGDWFQIENTSQEPWSIRTLTIVLRGSSGHLVFDTAAGGEGASMHTPFEVIGGEGVGYLGATLVDDGSDAVTLTFSDFLPGRSFDFIVDVDDRLADSDLGQAYVTGREIEGAQVNADMVTANGRRARVRGEFRVDGDATLGDGGLCS